MGVKKKTSLPVLIDSNFLFVPLKFKVDVFEELTNLINQRYEPILLSPTHRELLTIAQKGSPKMRRYASLALKIAEKCKLVSAERGYDETHDDVIVRVASEWKCPVATNDKALRKRLRNRGIPVVFLRQKHRLELEGNIM